MKKEESLEKIMNERDAAWARIEELEKQVKPLTPRWIPVSDPPQYEQITECFVFVQGEDFKEQRTCYWDERGFWLDDDGRIDGVTHWCPIPELGEPDD